MLIATILLTIVFFCFEHVYSKEIEFAGQFICKEIKRNFLFGYIMLIMITFPFNYLMVPGMNVLAILFGYLINDFIFSFVTFISLTLFWCVMSWLTYKKIFLSKLEEGFKKDKLFKILLYWSSKDQFKMTLLLRNLIIPLFYKNMFLILLETSFKNYILSAALIEGSHMVVYSMIGNHLREIKIYRNAKKNKEEYKDGVFWFKSIFTLIVISLNFYFVYKTY